MFGGLWQVEFFLNLNSIFSSSRQGSHHLSFKLVYQHASRTIYICAAISIGVGHKVIRSSVGQWKWSGVCQGTADIPALQSFTEFNRQMFYRLPGSNLFLFLFLVLTNWKSPLVRRRQYLPVISTCWNPSLWLNLLNNKATDLGIYTGDGNNASDWHWYPGYYNHRGACQDTLPYEASNPRNQANDRNTFYNWDR